MTTQPEQQTVHDQLAGRYLALTEQIEDLQEQREAVKAAIRALVEPGARVVTGSGARISVTQNKRLALDRLRPLLTAEQVADCTIEVLSNSLVKRHVAPEVIEGCMVEVGDPIVRVQ